MTAHSPSPEPWTYDEGGALVRDANGHLIASMESLNHAHDDANGHRIAALSAENARLREALTFYADRKRHTSMNLLNDGTDPFTTKEETYYRDIGRDCGEIARTALRAGGAA